MKIGYVVDDTLDKPDGVQQYVLAVGEWMRSRGHDVHYITGQTVRTDIANIHSMSKNMRVIFNGNRLTVPFRAPKRAIRTLLDAQQFDVLHVQMPYSPLMAQRVLRAARQSVAKVGTFHIMPYSRSVFVLTRVLGWVLRPSLRQLRYVFAVSPAAQEFANCAFGVNAVVLGNGIDLQPFLQAQPLPEYASKPTIAYLNRLVPRKGSQHLLAAVRALVQDMGYTKPFQVLVGGKGELSAELQHYIDRHNLADYVRLLGFVPEAIKPRFLASADIVVYPSTGGESFGIVLLEGMAASRGVVLAGNNPGYASVMHTLPDQLFDANDIAAFAELLKTYLDDPALRKERVRPQRELAQQFDIGVIGAKLEDYYQKAQAK